MRAKCATRYCESRPTPRSSWCSNCRASLYRWVRMTDMQRKLSWSRAQLRWSRVWEFDLRRRHGRRAA